jgi:hypothetical protein
LLLEVDDVLDPLYCKIKKPATAYVTGSFWRRHPDLNWGIEVLQGD